MEIEMGGGGSGGSSISSDELAKLEAAASARLKDLASKSDVILFAAEEVDRRSLDSHLENSKEVFPPARIIVFDGSNEAAALSAVSGSSFVVLFTDKAKDTTFLSRLADRALLEKRAGVHARATGQSEIPSKVTANRWRSVRWPELEEFFRST
jgi:hypothetical protein